MDRLTCEELVGATLGCEVVLLVATDVEASFLMPDLRKPQSIVVATKKLVIGDLAPLEAANGGRRVVLAISGLDKVNVAHILTCLLQAMDQRPRLVLQTGIAGAFAGSGGSSGALVGDVVVATQEAYSDTGSSSAAGWLSARQLGWSIALVDGLESGGIFPIDGKLVAAALEIIAAAAARVDAGALAHIRPEKHPRVIAGPCVTASLVTGVASEAREIAGRWQAVAESMEGAAAAHVCAFYRVPFLEVRGISNLVGERERATWEVQRAAAAASWAARAIVDGLDELPLSTPGTRLTGET